MTTSKRPYQSLSVWVLGSHSCLRYSESNVVKQDHNILPNVAAKTAIAAPRKLPVVNLVAPLVAEVEGAAEVELPEPVPFSCIARALKAAKLFGPDSTAFTENTIP